MNEQQLSLALMVGKQLNCIPNPTDHYSGIDSIMKEAKNQSVFPIAFANQKKRLDTYCQYDLFNREYFHYLAQNIRNFHSHVTVHKLLASNNIKYVFIKGYASARFYPVPKLRTMGDVDFLVQEQDVLQVDNLLRINGYVKSEESESHEYHWSYKRGQESVELHWNVPGLPENDATLMFYLHDIFEKSECVNLEGESVCVPSPFHHGMVLLLHTISHMTGAGVGLRHICDWLVFQNSISEKEFVSLFQIPLMKVGLWRFAKVLTRIGELYFDFPQRVWCEDIDKTVCQSFLEDVFRGGNFGVKDDTRKSQAKLIQNKQNKKVLKGHLWKNALISIDEKAKKDFSFCRRIIVLRPLAWFLVCFQYLFRILSGRRHNVFKRDIYRAASERQTLYAELKLFEKE